MRLQQAQIYVNFAFMSSTLQFWATRLWAAPVTLCALPLLPLALWHSNWRVNAGVVEVTSPALKWFLQGPWFRALSGGAGFSAATIGHVVIARNSACMTGCRAHEHAHVRQCERWGVLFPLAYVVAGLYAAFKARRLTAYYWDNAFEREARAAEDYLPKA